MFEFSEADEAFREEVRAFLRDELPEDLKQAARKTTTVFADKDIAMRWQKILVDKGWAVPSWPVEWGGTDWTDVQKFIFNEEMARARAPGLIPLGLRMLAPVLLKFGTEEQKAEFLPKMLSGEHYWCQGYSEPGSGSDLSSLKTSAVADGDDYIVNGTKIWTTHAHFADHIFCLVRTDPNVKPQAGITFLLVPMDLPGIKVEPIITMAGDHEVNQVFFDDVRVPQSYRVGDEGQGWTAAKYLLEFERGGGGAAVRLQVGIDELRNVARSEGLADSEAFMKKIDELEIRLRGLEHQELTVLARVAAGGSPGAAASLIKNSGVELGQDMERLRLEAVQHYALPDAERISLGGGNEPWVGPDYAETATGRFLNGRAASVFGGSKEVQKNIIAKTVLGL